MHGKVFNFKVIKANKIPKGKEHLRAVLCSSGDYFGQITKGGYGYIFDKDINGNCRLFSGGISKDGHLVEKSANVPHIIDFLDSRIPKGTAIAVEIYSPKISKNIGSIMNCKPEKAIERQAGAYGLVHAHIHDLLAYNVFNLVEKQYTNIQRYKLLERLVKELDLLEASFVTFAKAYYSDLDEMIDRVINGDEKGMILKKKDELYYNEGKRSTWNWIKFKYEKNY